jgi:hypothetical protein
MLMQDIYLIHIKCRSQTGYLFMCGNTAISWRSIKQILVSTSSNHVEILVIHKVSRESVAEIIDSTYSWNMWFILQQMISNHIVRR